MVVTSLLTNKAIPKECFVSHGPLSRKSESSLRHIFPVTDILHRRHYHSKVFEDIIRADLGVRVAWTPENWEQAVNQIRHLGRSVDGKRKILQMVGQMVAF